MLKVKKITSLFLSLSLAITPIFIFAEDEISLENESTIFEIAEGEEVESIDVAINVVLSKIAEDEKINKVEKVQGIIKITGEELAGSKGNKIIKIRG